MKQNILAKGAEAALGEYREWRKGRAANETVNENQTNRIGYDRLNLKRVKDAIEVFKQNVAAVCGDAVGGKSLRSEFISFRASGWQVDAHWKRRPRGG